MYLLHVKKVYLLLFYESGILDSVLNKFHFPSWKLPTTFLVLCSGKLKYMDWMDRILPLGFLKGFYKEGTLYKDISSLSFVSVVSLWSGCLLTEDYSIYNKAFLNSGYLSLSSVFQT